MHQPPFIQSGGFTCKTIEFLVRCICYQAAIAQLVERFHGKEEVSGSNPDRGSIDSNPGGFVFI